MQAYTPSIKKETQFFIVAREVYTKDSYSIIQLNIHRLKLRFLSPLFPPLPPHTPVVGKTLTVGNTATSDASDAYWTSIPITYLAKFELSYAATHTVEIPYSIPDSAQEVLVYTVVNVGASGPDSRSNVKIYTQEDYKTYAKYIAVHPYPQSAWSTNSENMWFPMTSNRKIYVNIPRGDEGNVDIEIYVIGYRQ